MPKSKNKPKTHILTVRLTDEEYNRLQLVLNIRGGKYGDCSLLMRKALILILDKETSSLTDRVNELMF